MYSLTNSPKTAPFRKYDIRSCLQSVLNTSTLTKQKSQNKITSKTEQQEAISFLIPHPPYLISHAATVLFWEGRLLFVDNYSSIIPK